MKKEQFIKGLEAVDDDLIAEAASPKNKGISYKAKMRITRFVMGAAVAAVMVGTGVLLRMNSGKAPEPDEFRAASVTEGSTKAVTQSAETEPQSEVITTAAETVTVTVTEVSTPEAVTDTAANTASEDTEEKLNITTTDTSTVTATVTEPVKYKTLAVTTTRTGTASTTTAKTTTPARTDTDVTTTGPVPDEEREFIYNGDFYFPMANYSYPGDENIVNVKYGTAVLRDRGAWINCSKNQADYILNSISAFELTDIVEDIGIEGGGFCVQIQYKDGTDQQYELFGWLGILYAKDTQGNVRRLKDVSGNADELTKYLQTEFMKIQPLVDDVFEKKYG